MSRLSAPQIDLLAAVEAGQVSYFMAAAGAVRGQWISRRRDNRQTVTASMVRLSDAGLVQPAHATLWTLWTLTPAGREALERSRNQ